jgi:ferredoxin
LFFDDRDPGAVLLEAGAAVGPWIRRGGLAKRGERMRVVVDSDLCEANEVCVSLCSDVFWPGEDDRATVLLDRLLEHLLPAGQRAVHSCPRQALSLRDRDPEEQR